MRLHRSAAQPIVRVHCGTLAHATYTTLQGRGWSPDIGAMAPRSRRRETVMAALVGGGVAIASAAYHTRGFSRPRIEWLMTTALQHSFGGPRPELVASPLEVAAICAGGGVVMGAGSVRLWRLARMSPPVAGAVCGVGLWIAGEAVVASSPDSRRRLMIQAPYRGTYFAATGALVATLAARLK